MMMIMVIKSQYRRKVHSLVPAVLIIHAVSDNSVYFIFPHFTFQSPAFLLSQLLYNLLKLR